MLKPLVKALKRWNHLNGKVVPSFLLEAISYQALPSKPNSYAEGLQRLFELASERIQQACPDPAGLGPNVDAGVDSNHRGQASQRLLGAARKAKQALEQESGSHLSTAHELWADLLGPDYRWR